MSNHVGEVYRNRKTDQLGTVVEIRPVFVNHKKTLEFCIRYHNNPASVGTYQASEFYRLFERVEG